MDVTPVPFKIANAIINLADGSGQRPSKEMVVGVAFAENINLGFMDHMVLRMKRRDLPDYRLDRIRQLWGKPTDDQRSRFLSVIQHPDHAGGGDLVMSWIGSETEAQQDSTVGFKPITQAHYEKMFNIMPQAFCDDRGFMVGEAEAHTEDGEPMYTGYVRTADKFFESEEPLTVEHFVEHLKLGFRRIETEA